MEEAIASSQMEGASTTRRIAKDMLRKQLKPINKSQQMIANNYETINQISKGADKDFSLEGILDIHRTISNKTLDNAEDEGVFRRNDDVLVVEGISHINERQRYVLQAISDSKRVLFTPKELATQFDVSAKSARTDLQELVKMGYLTATYLNKRAMGYIKSDQFDRLLSEKSNSD